MATDAQKPLLSHILPYRDDGASGEIERGSEREGGHGESYSVKAAILPFFFPALGGLLYGYDIGATSGATISLQSSTLSGTTWYDLSSVEIGLQVSGSLYGALLGSILAYTISDFLGRRRELMLSASLYLIGAILTASSPNFPTLVIGRVVYGIGIGLVILMAMFLFTFHLKYLGSIDVDELFFTVKRTWFHLRMSIYIMFVVLDNLLLIVIQIFI